MTKRELLPARHPDLEIAEFDAEFVVFDPRCNEVHHIVGLAAVVFDACNGVTPREDLVTDLVELLKLDRSTADEQVDESIDQFTGLGLLAGTDRSAAPP